MAIIEASLEELPVHAELGQSCLATKISALEPSLLGGSATKLIKVRFLLCNLPLHLIFVHVPNSHFRTLGLDHLGLP